MSPEVGQVERVGLTTTYSCFEVRFQTDEPFDSAVFDEQLDSLGFRSGDESDYCTQANFFVVRQEAKEGLGFSNEIMVVYSVFDTSTGGGEPRLVQVRQATKDIYPKGKILACGRILVTRSGERVQRRYLSYNTGPKVSMKGLVALNTSKEYVKNILMPRLGREHFLLCSSDWINKTQIAHM
jgi:hypothetical protein